MTNPAGRPHPATDAKRRLALLAAAFGYFGLTFCLAFVLGAVRTVVVAPRLGEVAAVTLETPILLVASWIVCGWTVRRFEVAARPAPRIAMGAIAFVLLMATELGLGDWLFARDPLTALQAWKTAPGAIGLAGQVLFAFVPLLRWGLARR